MSLQQLQPNQKAQEIWQEGTVQNSPSWLQSARHLSWTKKTISGIRMLLPLLDRYHLLLVSLGVSPLSHHQLAPLREQLAGCHTTGHCCHSPAHPAGPETLHRIQVHNPHPLNFKPDSSLPICLVITGLHLALTQPEAAE